MSAQNLKYFLEHPDEMPIDPKELERLTNEHIAGALDSGTEELDVEKIVGKEAEKTGEPAPAKSEEPPKEAAKPQEPEAKETKPEGILAKDGKNVIPYAQLESARQRAAQAEAKAAEATALAQQQAEELAALRAGKQPQDAEMLTEEELTALEGESPTLAKTLRGQQAAIRQLREELENVRGRQEAQAKTEEELVKDEIQAAIDANPMLAQWQADEDQTLWNEVVRFDKMLRESPRYAKVSFGDRFADAVELTRVSMKLPPEPKQETTLTQEELRAAAERKLADKSKASRPVSLSQIPGGAPPAVDERQKVEEMSSVALGNQFLGMTKDQIDAYLANL